MSDSFISILKNPEDWQFISQLTRALFLLKKDGKDFSLRNISTLTNTPFKSVSRKIERLYNSLSDTPFDTGSDTPNDTESKVVKVCKSFSYNLNKRLSDTPFDTAVTHQMTQQRKEPKEIYNISLAVDNKLSPAREHKNEEREITRTQERKRKPKFGSDMTAVEFNEPLVERALTEKQDYSPYETFVRWISAECGELLNIMKLPLEENYLKMLGYFGFDIIKETIRDMNNNIDYLKRKKYKEIGQTAYKWIKKEHPLIKPMSVNNPNDPNEVKFCDWVNNKYPNINALKSPFTYNDYCYLISKFDKNDVTKEIIYLSSKGFEGITNLRDKIEFFLLNR